MIHIAIFEDDLEKLADVRRVLEDRCGITSESIAVYTNIKHAREALRVRQFDLLVLDVNLPAKAGDGGPERGSGAALLEQVTRSAIYRRPRHVVFLSAFSEEIQRLKSVSAGRAWQSIEYQRSGTAWMTELIDKVEYINSTEFGDESTRYRTDALFLTALDQPELEAFENLGNEWKRENVGGISVLKASIKLRDERELIFVAAAAPQMGCTAAAVRALELIQTVRPRIVIMCGITAGIKNECNIGDILAADPCWEWGAGKYVERKQRIEFEAAPTQLRASSDLLTKLRERQHVRGILSELKKSWKGTRSRSTLKVKIGPTVSGAAVIASVKMVSVIRKQHRKLIGIDMETYGVYYAVEKSPVRCECVSLKSVCDFADRKKNDNYQAYAAYLSAGFSVQFVRHYLESQAI